MDPRVSGYRTGTVSQDSEDHAPRDIDRASILARRRMMIISSLAGLTVACTGPDRASPRPCLQVRGDPVSEEDLIRELETTLTRSKDQKVELQRHFERSQDAKAREKLRVKIEQTEREIAGLEHQLEMLKERKRGDVRKEPAGSSSNAASGAESSN